MGTNSPNMDMHLKKFEMLNAMQAKQPNAWQLVAALIDQKKWNEEVFCKRCGLDANAFFKAQRGDPSRPTLNTLMAVCVGAEADIRVDTFLLVVFFRCRSSGHNTIIQHSLNVVKGFLKVFLIIFSHSLNSINAILDNLHCLWYNRGGKGVQALTMELRINMAATFKGMSQAALARAIGMTPSNFNQKIKRGTFSEDELEQIAAALGATYTATFEFPDGTKI